MVYAYALLALSTILILAMAYRLFRALNKFSTSKLSSPPQMLESLPSVSVCVPARNEHHAMTACLERVLASTYPKIEIIVLDDESSDNTSVLIKSFAHAGVRFVEGSPLPAGWLGKNHALHSLLLEASGTYLLYIDVDTLVDPDTIGQLVAYAESEKVAAVSILPVRKDGYRASTIFGTLRYFWEILRHSAARPAASGGAWMINRKSFIDDFNGFESLKNQIQPESAVARHYSSTNRYRFLISSDTIGLSYEKKWHSQVDTSTRLLYPSCGSNLWGVLIFSSLLILMAYPVLMFIFSLIFWDVQTVVISFLVYILTCSVYGMYLRRVRTAGRVAGAVVWPYLVIQELAVLILSFYKYKAGKVTWKGRPIYHSDLATGRVMLKVEP